MRLLKQVLSGSAMTVLLTGAAFPVIAQETSSPPAAEAVPPPAAPAKRSAAELETLLGPIALYPDPLIATILPASVYPLEIVQAARFLADTNNLAKLDEQPWDDNVKAVARVPDALKKLNDDIQWTIQLGEAFLAQDKDVMDMIQTLRLKAQKGGTLRSTDQQIVTVTNVIVKTAVQQEAVMVTNTVVQTAVNQEVVVVTNTIVQIAPSNPEVIYVPQYTPAVVYYPPPTYVYSAYDPLITFAAGVAVGAIIANNCDWNHGGCYNNGGNYHGGNRNTTINGDINIGSGNRGNGNRVNPQGGQKWQPNQSRLNKSGAAGATSARSQQARGYGNSGTRTSTGAVGNRPSTGTAGARPSTGAVGARPSTGTATARPSTGNRPGGGAGPEIVRGSPSSTPSANRSSTTAGGGARQSPSQSSASRPSSGAGGGNNAFSGVGSGSSARQSSNRGSVSRGGGGARGGGGGRGGGGRR